MRKQGERRRRPFEEALRRARPSRINDLEPHGDAPHRARDGWAGPLQRRRSGREQALRRSRRPVRATWSGSYEHPARAGATAARPERSPTSALSTVGVDHRSGVYADRRGPRWSRPVEAPGRRDRPQRRCSSAVWECSGPSRRRTVASGSAIARRGSSRRRAARARYSERPTRARSDSSPRLADGMNATMDAFIRPMQVTADYVDQISKGDIPPRSPTTTRRLQRHQGQPQPVHRRGEHARRRRRHAGQGRGGGQAATRADAASTRATSARSCRA